MPKHANVQNRPDEQISIRRDATVLKIFGVAPASFGTTRGLLS
jgi:hypothetical protein